MNIEPLEAMIEKFQSGNYDTNAASVLSLILSGGSWDSFKGRLPDALIALIKETAEAIPEFRDKYARARNCELI